MTNSRKKTMPVIEITVRERVTYRREVEVTESEFRAMEAQLYTLTGREYDSAIEAITDKYIRRDDRDFFDAYDLELDNLRVIT